MIFNKKIRIYGDLTYRNKKCPREVVEQVTFFNTLKSKYPRLASVALHPRNEGKRSGIITELYKMEGMNTGAPDVIIPALVPFVCEIKRQDHTMSKWQKGQQDYLLQAEQLGCFACVALGYKNAWIALVEWMKNE